MLKGGLSVRFEGFREGDFGRLNEFVRRAGLLKKGEGIVKAKQGAKGWNWGELEVRGAGLTLNSGEDEVMDVALGDVAQVNLNATDELSLEFHLDDTAGPNDECLVEMRFRVGDIMKAKEIHEKIIHRADTSTFAGESLAAFSEVPVIVPRESPSSNPLASKDVPLIYLLYLCSICSSVLHFLLPVLVVCPTSHISQSLSVPFLFLAGTHLPCARDKLLCLLGGRYDVDLYPNYFKMHGKSYDFKVLYSSVSRLFLLPKPDEIHVAIVVSIDPPIRQGNTHYPHLIFQFQTEDEMAVEVKVSEEDLKKKYGGKIGTVEKGDSWKVFSKIMKTLSGKSLHTPKTFLSVHDQRAVRTSLGANEGYLFFLESCFFFVNKPTYVRFDDVKVVKFKRMELDRRFDLLVQTAQGQNLLFSNIDKAEFDKIHNFLKDKKVPMESPKDKQSSIRDVNMALGDDDDESEDEDFDPNAKPKKAPDGESQSEEELGSDEIDEDEIYPEDEESGSEGDDKPPRKKAKE